MRHDEASGLNASGIELFPNPAQNRLTLQLTGQEHAGQARIYNPQGRW